MPDRVTIESQKQIRELRPRRGDIMAGVLIPDDVVYIPVTLKGAYELLATAKAGGCVLEGSVVAGDLYLDIERE